MKSGLLKSALAVAVLFGVAAGYVWLQERNGAEDASYRLAKLERGALTAVVAASGTLNAVTTVQVGSQISGQVKEIYADFNSAVKQDQVIARIDPATFELRVNQARADLDAAHSAVAVARSGLAAQHAERQRQARVLSERGAVQQSDPVVRKPSPERNRPPLALDTDDSHRLSSMVCEPRPYHNRPARAPTRPP